MLYVESSAFAKRYLVDEEFHDECADIMAADPAWTTSRLTTVESARAIARVSGSRIQAASAITDLDADLMASVVFDVDRVVLSTAREIALETGIKTLDAIHLATALRVQDAQPRFLTYDERQSRAAQQVGLTLAR